MNTRRRRLPLAVAVMAACLLCAVNALPRLHTEIEVILGSGRITHYGGFRAFGWPAPFKADHYSVAYSIEGVSYAEKLSPLEHALVDDRIDVSSSEHSLAALIANVAFASAAVVLAGIACQTAVSRRFSLRLLFAVTTSLGVMLGSLIYAGSLPRLLL